MPKTESVPDSSGTLYCWDLPAVVVTAFNSLAARTGWYAESLLELPNTLPEDGLSGLCLPESTARDSLNIPPERILLLASDAVSNATESPIIQLPMRAKALQEALERIRMTFNIHGKEDLANYYIRTVNKTLYQEGTDSYVALTDREADIIGFLLQCRAGANREEILEKVWGYSNEIDTQTLETHVSRLRTKIGVVSLELRLINGMYFLQGV